VIFSIGSKSFTEATDGRGGEPTVRKRDTTVCLPEEDIRGLGGGSGQEESYKRNQERGSPGTGHLNPGGKASAAEGRTSLENEEKKSLWTVPRV